MDGDKRRQQIMEILNQETSPVSGAELAKRAGVSRQVVVQDIALLRAENKEIMSTNKGYVLYKPQQGAEKARVRVFRVNHDTEHMLDELQTIVDYGGRILDVSIEHALYGQISVDLIINNRLDALEFVNGDEQGSAVKGPDRRLPLPYGSRGFGKESGYDRNGAPKKGISGLGRISLFDGRRQPSGYSLQNTMIFSGVVMAGMLRVVVL